MIQGQDLREQTPQRFEPHGLSHSLDGGGRGEVRVDIVTRDDARIGAEINALRPQLSPDPSPADTGALRKFGRERTVAYAQTVQAMRAHAIRALHPRALKALSGEQRVVERVRSLGGRIVRGASFYGTVTAVLPRQALKRLSRQADVQAIQPAYADRPLDDLASESADVGADAWWQLGFTGGEGRSDNPASLAVVEDPMDRTHPALQSLTFEAPSTEAWQGPDVTVHGTAVVSMAASRGAAGCSMCLASDASQKGIAPGVSRVLEADHAANDLAWAVGEPWSYWDSTAKADVTQPGAADPAQVLTYSRGSAETADDNGDSQGWDAYVDVFGVTATIPAGNSGPAQGTINEPSDAYNVISVGGVQGLGSADRSGDQIWSWSSEGPTVGGRRKPDLVAAGDGDLADSEYETDGTLWRYQTGTSFAAPQVGGTAMLLAGAGITDPRAVKAILINSALPGRTTPSSPMGSQTAWQPNWGWGELDLNKALHQRLNFSAGSVPANGVAFFRSSARAAGDRATLVWDRRVIPCYDVLSGCGSWQVFTLSHLGLSEFDAATGAAEGNSNSQVDNVQQVRAQAAGNLIYKISAGPSTGFRVSRLRSRLRMASRRSCLRSRRRRSNSMAMTPGGRETP